MLNINVDQRIELNLLHPVSRMLQKKNMATISFISAILCAMIIIILSPNKGLFSSTILQQVWGNDYTTFEKIFTCMYFYMGTCSPSCRGYNNLCRLSL